MLVVAQHNAERVGVEPLARAAAREALRHARRHFAQLDIVERVEVVPLAHRQRSRPLGAARRGRVRLVLDRLVDAAHLEAPQLARAARHRDGVALLELAVGHLAVVPHAAQLVAVGPAQHAVALAHAAHPDALEERAVAVHQHAGPVPAAVAELAVVALALGAVDRVAVEAVVVPVAGLARAVAAVQLAAALSHRLLALLGVGRVAELADELVAVLVRHNAHVVRAEARQIPHRNRRVADAPHVGVADLAGAGVADVAAVAQLLGAVERLDVPHAHHTVFGRRPHLERRLVVEAHRHERHRVQRAGVRRRQRAQAVKVGGRPHHHRAVGVAAPHLRVLRHVHEAEHARRVPNDELVDAKRDIVVPPLYCTAWPRRREC
jgi:hypothetical protein